MNTKMTYNFPSLSFLKARSALTVMCSPSVLHLTAFHNTVAIS